MLDYKGSADNFLTTSKNHYQISMIELRSTVLLAFKNSGDTHKANMHSDLKEILPR